MPNLPQAKLLGHVDLQRKEELKTSIQAVTLDAVINHLTIQPEEIRIPVEPYQDIVFTGTFEEVNRFFYENEWSDGLPIVPPTKTKVEEFLKFTDRSPHEVLGILLPDHREATIWNIAVNGVMAGCRPEYMPVLIAIVEAMVDPKYGVEHSGNTPGSDTLITLNGPIIKALDFNYEQGVLRDGFQPNTAIGRFFRLSLRNIAGFLLHKTDKATFGNTWRVVLAENEDALAKIGWTPTSVDQGFKLGDNVLTMARYTGGKVIAQIVGSRAEEILPVLTDAMAKLIGWEFVFTVGELGPCTQRPHLLLTPCIAEVIARSGYTKKDVKQYLYKHARVPAWQVNKYVYEWAGQSGPPLCEMVEKGKLPEDFCESTDPNRLVPIVCSPDDFLISVTGDPLRTNAYIFVHNGFLGYTTSKRINLPSNWNKLLEEAQRK